MTKMTAKEFLNELLSCQECKPNFDGKGGWKFCGRHWKLLQERPWQEGVDLSIA